MNPVQFPESNCFFGTPEDLHESQCQAIAAYKGTVESGSLEGALLAVTAWKPTPEELVKLNEGSPIFVSFLGGVPPHMLTTNFQQACLK